MTYINAKKSLKGFTLTELMVALGIAGIVMAGAWMAGSSANQKALVSQAADQIWQVSASIRNAYTGRLSGNLSTGNLVCAGIFPPSMLQSSSTTTCSGVSTKNPVGPWGGDALVSVIYVAAPGPSYYLIDFPVKGGNSVCVNLISNFFTTNKYQDNGPGEIYAASTVAGLSSASTLWTNGQTLGGIASSVNGINGGCGAVRVRFNL